MANESDKPGSEPVIEVVSGGPDAQLLELVNRERAVLEEALATYYGFVKFTLDGLSRQSTWEFWQLLQDKSFEKNPRRTELLNGARIMIEWYRDRMEGRIFHSKRPMPTLDIRKADASTTNLEDLLDDGEFAETPIPVTPDLDIDPKSKLGAFFRSADYMPLRSAKGWFALDTHLRCNLGCEYCYGSMYGKEQFGKPLKIFDEHDGIDLLLNHPYFQADTEGAEFYPSPIALNTSSTEVFLPEVKKSTFKSLELLNKSGIRNKVILVTKYFLTEEDVARLDAFENIQINVLMSYSAMPREIEPGPATESIVEQRKNTIKLLSKCKRVKVMQCYRPIAIGWNDEESQIEEALGFGKNAGSIILGGVTLTDVIKRLMAEGKKIPLGPIPCQPDQGWTASNYGKFLPPELIAKVMSVKARLGIETPLVRRVSCGISIANGEPDYNAHNAESREKNCSTCPQGQREICGTGEIPDENRVQRAFNKMGWKGVFTIMPNGIDVNTEFTRCFSPWDRDAIIWGRSFGAWDAFALRHLLHFPVKLDRNDDPDDL